MRHTLEAKKLSKIIKKSKIIHNVSLKVTSGEVVGLLGPNGAGKSTSFYMICGITDVTTGKVLLDDRDITNLSLSTRAKLGIGYLPQESSIFKDLTVEDNLIIAGKAIGLDRKKIDDRIKKFLPYLI